MGGEDKQHIVCSKGKKCTGNLKKEVKVGDKKIGGHKDLGCEGVPKHPVKVWQDGYGLKLCPHTAYWNALTKAMDGNLDDFICRPSFNGGAKGILPWYGTRK